jgi:hypothetical protein
MSMLPFWFKICGVLIVLAVLYLFLVKVRQLIAHRRLEQVARGLGLERTKWTEGKKLSTLEGWKGTTPVKLVNWLWGTVEARVRIEAPLPPGLSLTPEHQGGRRHGLEDVQVGVADLDAGFQVQCENPASAIRFLREEQAQKALRDLLATLPRASVISGEVRFSTSNTDSREALQRMVDTAIRGAQALAAAAGGSAPSAAPASKDIKATGPHASRFSPEYLSRVRREHAWRSTALGGALMVALVSIPLSIVLENGLLDDFLPASWHSVNWGLIVVGLMAVAGVLYFILHRCPSCSALLEKTEADEEAPQPGGRQRGRCPDCGIRLT